jgi:cell cycle checkpoint protein
MSSSLNDSEIERDVDATLNIARRLVREEERDEANDDSDGGNKQKTKRKKRKKKKKKKEKRGKQVRPCLEAKMDRASTLVNMLTPINFVKDGRAIVTVSQQGLKFTVEDGKTSQANVFVAAKLFHHWHVREPKFTPPKSNRSSSGSADDDDDYDKENGRQQQDDSESSSSSSTASTTATDKANEMRCLVQFCVPLNHLIECLSIFGGGTHHSGGYYSSHGSGSGGGGVATLDLSYAGPGNDLVLLLTQGEAVTNVALRTLDSDGITDFNFRNRATPIRNKVIMVSDSLREAFAELDWSNADVSLLMSPDHPHFRIATVGPSGSCQVDFPRDSASFELFESFQTQVFSYKLKNLQPGIKGLGVASKTQIRLNDVGMLNLQHLVNLDDGERFFVDFYLVPSDDEDIVLASTSLSSQ